VVEGRVKREGMREERGRGRGRGRKQGVQREERGMGKELKLEMEG
jgi:hypothetical protein